jgi:hypothetical protein
MENLESNIPKKEKTPSIKITKEEIDEILKGSSLYDKLSKEEVEELIQRILGYFEKK